MTTKKEDIFKGAGTTGGNTAIARTTSRNRKGRDTLPSPSLPFIFPYRFPLAKLNSVCRSHPRVILSRAVDLKANEQMIGTMNKPGLITSPGLSATYW